MTRRSQTLLAGLGGGVALVAAIVLWLLQAFGSFDRPPQMARGQDIQFGTDSPTWSRLLLARYPLGTPEAVVVRDLAKQGFAVDRVARRAVFKWGKYPCNYILNVDWQVKEQGRIVAIGGDYWNVCV